MDAPARLGEFGLGGGRVLGWAEWGPPGGVPVLFSPGAATSRRLGFGAGHLDELGVRLISIDRPGLGVSTLVPDQTFDRFAADIGAFCAGRRLGVPAMVGNSQGTPFALACVLAGVAGPLALVSPMDEVARLTHRLPDGQAKLVRWVASDPQAVEAFFAGFGADDLLKLILDASPPEDLAVYRSPAFHTAFRAALDDGFRQGPAGYARETAMAMGRWPFDLGAVTTPVDIWFGELDTSHSPDQGATLVARIPGARRRLVPGAGGAILWTHPEPMLRTLLARTPGTPARPRL